MKFLLVTYKETFLLTNKLYCRRCRELIAAFNTFFLNRTFKVLKKPTKPAETQVQCTVLKYNKEFKKRRRLRQRQRHKAVILLIKRTKMIVLHVRHAFLNNSLPYTSKLLHEMTKFKVLKTTWTNYSESSSLTLYFKSVRTNPVLGHFAHIE